MSDEEKNISTHYHYYVGPGASPPGQAPQGRRQGRPPAFGPGSAPINPHPHPGADSLVKGLVVGASAAYLLTNETAQRVILRAAVQAWSFVRGGVEELKERFHDTEAEVAAEATHAPSEPELAAKSDPAPKSDSAPKRAAAARSSRAPKSAPAADV
jgi:hypothetical protein